MSTRGAAGWMAACAAAAWLAGCGVREGGEAGGGDREWAGAAEFSGERALADARAFYELGPKEAGGEGARRGAEWIADRLKEAGAEVEIDEFEEETRRGRVVFRNVEGRLGRGGRRVIFGAHYDTKSGIPGGFAGANDSASGVGALLEAARALGRPPEGTEVRLLFFDGEECVERYGKGDGLHGSQRAAGRLKAAGETGGTGGTKGFLLLDMIGDADLRVTFPRNSDAGLARAAMEAAQAEGRRAAFSLYPGTILDDHVPFAAEGVPALDFIDFEYGSGPGRNDYWHTAADTPDKLSAESLETVGRVAVRLARDLLK